MSNNGSSKERFNVPPCPRITVELLAHLNALFPERCPSPEETLPNIFYESGKRQVVNYLIRIFEEQNDNVLQ